jgi:purine nucleoside permease
MTVDLDALVLPAFDDIEGLPGEATPWREAYDLDPLEVAGIPTPLRHGEGIGVVPTGIGKTAAATTTTALLASDAVALDDALVLSVGVAGGPPDVGVGSVVVADAIIDWDDKCRLDDGALRLNPYTDEQGSFELDAELVAWAREAAADVELAAPETPSGAAAGAATEPAVVGGTNVCGDELWHGEQLAEQVAWLVEQYGVGPYRATEMEDAGTAAALDRFGRLEQYLSVRAISNHDRPAAGESGAETLFSEGFEAGFGVAIENAVAVAQAILAADRER